ncbi:hypothetical protein MUP59_06070, partial [Candidatus Bathyarchaeota archaeon]|nr:hypothetical protein [Candidatus Bathyarchaeota archaeon]
RIGTPSLIASFLTSSALATRNITRIFEISHSPISLLLPLHHAYKLAAWTIGYSLSSDPRK